MTRIVGRVVLFLCCLLSFSAGAAQADSKNAIPEELPGPEPATWQLMLDGSFAASGTAETGNGGGAALRVGRIFPLKWVAFVPELGVDYFAFSGPQKAQVYGGFGGCRLRVGRGVEPGVFAHFGVAGVHARDDHAAATADVGVSLDFTYFPRMLLGVQGEYKSSIGSGGNPAFSWYTAGLNAGTRF